MTTTGDPRPVRGRWRPSWGRLGPPARATSMAGWALLPLRAFLGGTFTFAGLQKLANPGFFDASNPTSIQAQLASAARVSPIHALVAHLQHVAVPLGVAIALGELAVGVATLVGLWSRVAAVGGMLLSLSLFLTVSYHSSPYYTGSDIVFLFAWIPLLVAGIGRCAVGRRRGARRGPGPSRRRDGHDRPRPLRSRADRSAALTTPDLAETWPVPPASPPRAPICARPRPRRRYRPPGTSTGGPSRCKASSRVGWRRSHWRARVSPRGSAGWGASREPTRE